MRNSIIKFIYICLTISILSCNEDNSSLIDDLPNSIVNDDPDGAPPRGLTENWENHSSELNRQSLEAGVAVYYDYKVNRDIEWPFSFFRDSWLYCLEVYGDFGLGSNLYVVGHGEEMSSLYKTYFDTDSGRNLIDFNLTNTESIPEAIDGPASLIAKLVENANNGVNRSPSEAVWQNKFQEIFVYDLYVGIGRDGDAERVKTDFSAKSANFPKAETFWFQDWFLPIYENYEGPATLSNFFRLLATNYPKDGNAYARDMNLGEMVHFFSGATGEDLEPLAVSAFGFTEEDKNQLLQARAEFPDLNYPFEPASELIDVTTEGAATIEVSKDNGDGPAGNEGSLKLLDGDPSSKFLTDGFPQEFFMQQNFEVAQVVNRYTFTSGNDAPDRDFKTWELLGSNDGVEFEILDTRTDQEFVGRNQTREFNFENETAYNFYRINLIENNGSTLVQLSEWRLLNLELLTVGPEDITTRATLDVSAENRDGADADEGSSKLIDEETGTKFLVFDFTTPLNITQIFEQGHKVTRYTLTSANDAPGRDPLSWVLSGSNDGINFEVLDTRENEIFENRELTRVFMVTNEETYISYRLEITANGGDNLFQLAEWRLLAE